MKLIRMTAAVPALEPSKFLGITLIVVATSTILVESANILFFFALSTYSHRIIVWPLVQKLVENGHNVTFAQSYPPKLQHRNRKVTELFPEELLESGTWTSSNTSSIVGTSIGPIPKNADCLYERIQNRGRLYSHLLINSLGEAGLAKCDETLVNPKIKAWLNNSTNVYDLIVIDALFNECGFGLAYKLNTSKIVLFGTTSIFSWLYDEFGIATESSWISDMFVTHSFPLNLYQRLETSLVVFYQFLYRNWVYFPKLDKIMRERLESPEMPGVKNLLQERTRLILVNSHFSEEFPRNLPPFVVPIAGMQCDEQFINRDILDKELEAFCNNAGDTGFIYVSFGTKLQGISTAATHVQTKFFTAFQKVQTRFVLSWKGPKPAGLPLNVFTSAWLPQQALLSHPNVKGFITHGGLSSLQEAITFAVPLIVFPIFAEQDFNAARVKANGLGIVMEISKFEESELISAINEILYNKSYKITIQRASKGFKDRPQSPVDLATFWVEYILRHDDSVILDRLKPYSMRQSWYERRQLDVGIVLLALFVVLGFIFHVGMKLVVKFIVRAKELYKTFHKLKIN